MTSVCSVRDFADESIRYRLLGDQMAATSDVLILSGHNCGLKVRNSALHVRTGSVLGEDKEPLIYYRGTVPIRTIVMLSRSGSISIDALYWCRDQGVSLLLLDGKGNMVHSISPENRESVTLRRLQYHAVGIGLDRHIARELVRMKTLAQIEMLKTLPKRYVETSGVVFFLGVVFQNPDERVKIPVEKNICKPLEDGLAELPRMKDMLSIITLEGRLADAYWNAFIGLPIRWERSSIGKVPPHWMYITGRRSPISRALTPQHAINPFHLALNYLYGVVEHQLLCAIRAAGLDPVCGFLHADNEYRNSLVYDLIEPHRAEIDGKVFAFFNRTELKRGDITLFPSGEIAFNKEFLRYMVASCMISRSRFDETVSWLKGVLTS